MRFTIDSLWRVFCHCLADAATSPISDPIAAGKDMLV
jgi:hypothetical protein